MSNRQVAAELFVTVRTVAASQRRPGVRARKSTSLPNNDRSATASRAASAAVNRRARSLAGASPSTAG